MCIWVCVCMCVYECEYECVNMHMVRVCGGVCVKHTRSMCPAPQRDHFGEASPGTHVCSVQPAGGGTGGGLAPGGQNSTPGAAPTAHRSRAPTWGVGRGDGGDRCPSLRTPPLGGEVEGCLFWLLCRLPPAPGLHILPLGLLVSTHTVWGRGGPHTCSRPRSLGCEWPGASILCSPRVCSLGASASSRCPNRV